MKRSLRKTSSGVSVTYSTGNFSNNLTGTNFTVEATDEIIRVGIDLSSNLRVRNKQSNCYFDANELAKDHSLLKSLRIDGSKIIASLIETRQMYIDASWELELSLGEKGLFKYSVSVSGSNGSIFFNIEDEV
ncbi:hypothetical protein ACFLU3_00385 [Chloroflexota bacterium]